MREREQEERRRRRKKKRKNRRANTSDQEEEEEEAASINMEPQIIGFLPGHIPLLSSPFLCLPWEERERGEGGGEGEGGSARSFFSLSPFVVNRDLLSFLYSTDLA